MRHLVLSGLLLFAAPAAAADQFDLACTGERENWHYRVDLVRQEWCADKCDVVFKIASVTSGTLLLQNANPQTRGGDRITNSINRATGEWYFYRSFPGVGFYKTIKGKCEPAAFSGFPQAKF